MVRILSSALLLTALGAAVQGNTPAQRKAICEAGVKTGCVIAGIICEIAVTASGIAAIGTGICVIGTRACQVAIGKVCELIQDPNEISTTAMAPEPTEALRKMRARDWTIFGKRIPSPMAELQSRHVSTTTKGEPCYNLGERYGTRCLTGSMIKEWGLIVKDTPCEAQQEGLQKCLGEGFYTICHQGSWQTQIELCPNHTSCQESLENVGRVECAKI